GASWPSMTSPVSIEIRAIWTPGWPTRPAYIWTCGGGGSLKESLTTRPSKRAILGTRQAYGRIATVLAPTTVLRNVRKSGEGRTLRKPRGRGRSVPVFDVVTCNRRQIRQRRSRPCDVALAATRLFHEDHRVRRERSSMRSPTSERVTPSATTPGRWPDLEARRSPHRMRGGAWEQRSFRP